MSVSKYKTKRKSDQRLWKKTALGLILLSGVTVWTMGIAFADADASMLLQQWYDQKAQEAKSDVASAVWSETEIQKVKLRNELNSIMQAASSRLNQFSEEQKQAHQKAVREYADQLIDSFTVSHDTEEQELEKILRDIQERAVKEMEQVVTDYSSARASKEVQEGAASPSSDVQSPSVVETADPSSVDTAPKEIEPENSNETTQTTDTGANIPEDAQQSISAPQ